MAQTVALVGAGGKMGCRITDQIRNDPAYDVRYVEPDPAGQQRLAEYGVTEVLPATQAVSGADIVILAVPDDVLGTVASELMPTMAAGAMMVLLDPAAAYAGTLPEREDVTVFISHPCHPSFFTAETAMDEPDTDWFGGNGRDPQDIVCALHAGPAEAAASGEAVARDIYAPVREAYHISTEQMAILEPALVETLLGTCLTVIKEGLDRAIEMGVPEEAAEAMLFGHLRIELGIIFGYTDFPFSDGAQHAIDEAKAELFVADWDDRVFGPERIQESVEAIAGARSDSSDRP